jgi:histidine kinase
MNRLLTRLIASHLAVAVLGVLTTFVVVRQLAPALFDESMRMGGGVGAGSMRGGGAQLRQQFSDAVDQSVVVGAVVGAAGAGIVGALLAVRVLRPLGRVRAATRRLAQGEYAVQVPEPREAELAALVHDVNRLGHELAQTEARRVALLGDVAHEMRTPMTVIDGYVEGMIDGVIPTGPEELAHVGAEVRRLRRLADDLRSLSRAEEGRLDVIRARLDLGAVAAACVERLQPQAAAAGLTLSSSCPDRAVEVAADADRLAQVVTNLVGNAVRATAPGGSVTVTVGSDPDRAWLRVCDTGIGLAPDEIDRVFERFYRAGSGAAPGTGWDAGATSGSGVGLTIARGIMRAHGGDLTAESAGPGKGATFVAWLPTSTG